MPKTFTCPTVQLRSFSGVTDVIKLDSNLKLPENGNRMTGALVILHGLFGSKRNWNSLSKQFMEELDIPVYALDLRNQGESPHVRPMDYTHMAKDVLHFIKENGLNRVNLLGHSMGGKAAMSLALHPDVSDSGLISSLIVADVSPTRAELSPEFKGYIQGMKKIESLKVTSKKDAEKILRDYEPDPTIRMFLLTNLCPITKAHPYARFRVPLDILDDAIPEIGSFPYLPGEREFKGRTLFIKGTQSAYINRHSMSAIHSFFPNMKMAELDAGHWVHGERPAEFLRLVSDFIGVHKKN
ncbi:alpha/beta-hydrolase [Crucibulum laeve]|uniref:Alpha/beta-hydrolase n=1 Tax=Crucibulum laeve TaxID=68775 RepID=A0A5C3LLB3_9AGAR|nr:alpha/beta-hydrolase [Crucibulum laeve]